MINHTVCQYLCCSVQIFELLVVFQTITLGYCWHKMPQTPPTSMLAKFEYVCCTCVICGMPTAIFFCLSYLKGYRFLCTYIATQGPLSNTVNDFWKMIMEQQSKTIVMLCPLAEEGEESSVCYWPTAAEPVQYGTVSVHLLSSAASNNMVIRKLKITEDIVSYL